MIRCFNFDRFKNQKGSALVTVLMISIIITILGISLISVAASNFRLTVVDRDFQAVYYIAESGANIAVDKIRGKVDELSEQVLSHDAFFQSLNNYINNEINTVTLDQFEESFGEQPVAEVTVTVDDTKRIERTEDDYTEEVNTYVITSIGRIGDRKRTVNTTVDIAHRIDIVKGSKPSAFDYAVYSSQSLSLPNTSNISGDVYSSNVNLKSAGTQIDGNVISETSVSIQGSGNIPRVTGNVYALNGDVNVAAGGGSGIVEGSVHANGNVTLGSSNGKVLEDVFALGNVSVLQGASVSGNVHSSGNVTVSANGSVSKDLFSMGNVTLKSSNAMISGNLHAAGDVLMESGTKAGQNVYLNGDLTMQNSNKNNNSVIQGNVFAGGNIYKGNNTQINGNSWAGGSTNQHNPGNVNVIIQPENKPKNPQKPTFPIVEKVLPPELSVFSPDTSKNITVPQGSTNFTIEPGVYGDLFVNGGSTVVFKSGDYVFNKIDGARWGQSIRLDLSNGPINIYSKGDIMYTGPVYVTENAKDWKRIDVLYQDDPETAIRLAGMVYWETHGEFYLNNSATPRHWFGTVYANMDVDLSNCSSAFIIGALATNKGVVTSGNNPTIIYAPLGGEDTGGGNGGSGGGPSGEGKNSLSPDLRFRINPIREN